MKCQILLCIMMMIVNPVMAPQRCRIPLSGEIQAQIPKGKRVLLLGDSLAEGMSSHFYETSRRSGYVPFMRCIHSTRIDHWAPKFEKIIKEINPSLAIISLGTNDAAMSNPESQRHHIKNIKNTANKYGTKIIWILPPQLPPRFIGQEAIRHIIKDELHEDAHETTIKLEKIKDQVHLTRRGYEAWINSVWKFLVDRRIVLN